jgi:hypothetical protein
VALLHAACTASNSSIVSTARRILHVFMTAGFEVSAFKYFDSEPKMELNVVEEMFMNSNGDMKLRECSPNSAYH